MKGHGTPRNAVVLTGASSGIGSEMASLLAARGFRLVLLGHRKRLEQVSRQLSQPHVGHHTIEEFDLRNLDGLDRDAARLFEKNPDVGLLINCAGFSTRKTSFDHSLSDIQDLVNVNLVAPILLSVYASRFFIEQGTPGTILHVASTCGRRGIPFEAAYSASKAGLVGWAEVQAAELASFGIRVKVFHPSEVDTWVWATKVGELPPLPHGSLTSPRACAEAVVGFLGEDGFEGYLSGAAELDVLRCAADRKSFLERITVQASEFMPGRSLS